MSKRRGKLYTKMRRDATKRRARLQKMSARPAADMMSVEEKKAALEQLHADGLISAEVLEENLSKLGL